MLVWCFALPASAVVAPIQTGGCDLSRVGITEPSGIAYDPIADATLVVDAQAQEATLLSRTCEALSSFALDGVKPTAVTYDPLTRRYVVLDGLAKRLIEYERNGEIRRACRLSENSAPTGVAFDRSRNQLALVDEASVLQRVALNVGAEPCEIFSSDSLAPLGIARPIAVSFDTLLERIVVLDSAATEVFRLTPELTLVDSFDTGIAINGGTSSGLAFDSSRNRYLLVDDFDQVWREVDARGSAEFKCSIDPLPADKILGGTYDRSTARIVLLVDEPGARQLVFVSSTTCAILDTVDISAQGVLLPSGLGFDRRSRELIVSDPSSDALFFFDFDTRTLNRRCSLLDTGFFGVTGVTTIAEFGWYVLTNEGDTMVVLNEQCEFITQSSTDFFAADAAGDISYRQTDGRLFIVDGSRSVRLVDFEGNQDLDISSGAVGSIAAAIVIEETDKFWTIDDTGLNLFEFTTPLLEETKSLTGGFRGGLSLLLTLLPRGDDTLIGVFDLGPDNPVPAWARWEPGDSRLELTYRDGNGELITLIGTVSEDLNFIAFPGDVGVLVRVSLTR